VSRQSAFQQTLTRPFSTVHKILRSTISLHRRVDKEEAQPLKEISQASSFRDTTAQKRRVAPIRRAGLGGASQDLHPLPPAGLDLTALTRLVMRRSSQTYAAGDQADPFKLAPLPPRRASGGPEDCRSQATAPPPTLPTASHGVDYTKARFRQQAAAAQRFAVVADVAA
jgi:hypothetical protein